MNIKKIYAVWIYVKDLKESRQFYEQMLNLKVKLQENDWLEFNLGSTSFALLQRPKEKGLLKPQKTRIMFQVDSIQQVKEQLENHNVKIIGDVRNESYGKLLTFEDPNGHWLEVFEPKE